MTDNRTSDRLRGMLDERGVKYEIDDSPHAKATSWFARNGKLATFAEYKDGSSTFSMDSLSLTPEQAIAATLGGGKLTAEQVRELIAPHLHAKPTFDFGRHGAVWKADFQAIADELNDALGSGTCEVKYDLVNGYDQWTCSSCRESWVQDTHLPTACPNCGKAVKGCGDD